MWEINERKKNEIFAYAINVLSDDEISTIIRNMQNNGLERGKIYSEGLTVNLRSSEIAWLKSTDENYQAIFQKICGVVKHLNDTYFNYDITHFEDLQFTEYVSEKNGHYNYHSDDSYDGPSTTRKLSFSLLLSDPDSYEGADLEFMRFNSEIPIKAPRLKNSLVLFPSSCLHCITPITKGKRNSLVSWVHGPKLK